MLLSILFAGFITLLCWYIIKGRTNSSLKLPLPPGPRPLPVIGNVHQVPKTHAWKQFHAWGKAYGHIIHLNMLGQPIIVVSTTKSAHELLAVRGATFSDRPRLVVKFGPKYQPHNERSNHFLIASRRIGLEGV